MLHRRGNTARYLAALCSCLACHVTAADFYEQEDALRLRLRNEMRRADKPSAGSAHDIYAWVQGAALEYNSPFIGDTLGLDAGLFYTQRLGDHEGWSTRWYLDEDASFSRYTAALKVKLSDTLKLKVGRMVTDSAYSGQDDIPLINSSSQRTQPSLSDGALLKYSPQFNIDVYGMYRTGVYNYPDVALGVHKAGPINPDTYTYDLLRPQYLVSTVYHKNLDTYAFSASWQDDVSGQVMGRVAQRYAISADGQSFVKPEFVAFYARLNGMSTRYDGSDHTYVMGGKLSYINQDGATFVAVGKAGPKLNWLAGVDTDLSYTFELSIDRNYSDMWSWQAGHTWDLPRDTFVGVAQLFTRGYEDYHRNVLVRGAATDVYVGYGPRDGVLKGFRSLLTLSLARERRDASSLGDRLDYFDVKMTLQYDFNLR